jgi:chemotaxis methyl-accepting protein methylase
MLASANQGVVVRVDHERVNKISQLLKEQSVLFVGRLESLRDTSPEVAPVFHTHRG